MRGVFGKSTCTAALICGLSAAALARPGADVIVGDIPSAANNPASGGFDAFAIGTTSCNPGDTPLNWFTSGTDNRHPVIGQNVFRLHNGRFEQIGQSWLKHGFTALQQNACNLGCTATAQTTLGIGCSDPYSAGLNNTQSGLGPKWQVNASTGLFPYPFANPAFSGELARRIRIRATELDAATYPGALYFAEAQYVGGDDAANNNNNNNASYRRANVTGGPVEYSMALSGFTGAGNTVRELPAVYAWQAQDASVTIQTADVAGDGRYILACKVSGPVSGVYTYEYALHNLNSHRSAASFSVPFPTAGAASASTGRGFRDVEYHSGEPNEVANPASDDWSIAPTGASLTWSGASYVGSAPIYTTNGLFVTGFTPGTGNDHTANAIRWGTLFNFRFQSTTAPGNGQIQIGLFRPGTPTTLSIPVRTPGGATTGVPATAPCCVAGICTLTTQAACSGAFGTIGATCSPDPCLTGSCCTVAGGCSDTTQSGCTSTWNSGGTCTPNPCPAPTGACCTAGACAITTAAACSGTYRGNGVACTANLCTNAVNDICSAAIGVCDGVNVNGTNVNAGEESTACVTSNSDVWYRYVPAVSALVDIATITGGSIGDTVLSLHTACNGAFVACDDDGGPGALSLINDFPATGGVAYFIRVASYGITAEGTFVLRVTGGGGQTCISGGSCCQADQTCAVTTQAACSGVYSSGGTCAPNICPPPNDNCSGRIGLGTGTIAISTLYATTDGPDHPTLCNFFGNPGISNDIWYNHPSVITGTLDISTCGSGFDTEIAVYSGPTCGDYEARLIACNDDLAGCTNNGSFLTINVVAGQSYLIRLGGFNGASGTGTLTLTPHPVAVDGACCASDGGCTTSTQAACSGTWSAGVCSPNPCPQPPTGACCNGTTCSVGTQVACGAGTYQGNSSACGAAGNPTTCCPANYNQSGGITVQDIFDFLAGYFADAPAADFNVSGAITVQDIFDFLAAYFAGC